MTPSPEEIEAGKTSRGGWTREQLAKWGIPWPPPKGWRQNLELEWQRAQQPEASSRVKRVAIARYTRRCSKCGDYIHIGEKIRPQMVRGKKTWVHENCYMPPDLKREVDRMNGEFRNITR